jgi:hypothetical protein
MCGRNMAHWRMPDALLSEANAAPKNQTHTDVQASRQVRHHRSVTTTLVR